MGMEPDGTFTAFFVIFGIVFAAVIGVFVLVAVRGISQWNRNNNSPLITTPATVIAKRTDLSSDMSSDVHDHHGTTSSYFVTFQLQGGERLELQLSGSEFGLLVERDRGQLKHQGTRYKGFAVTPRDV